MEVRLDTSLKNLLPEAATSILNKKLQKIAVGLLITTVIFAPLEVSILIGSCVLLASVYRSCIGPGSLGL